MAEQRVRPPWMRGGPVIESIEELAALDRPDNAGGVAAFLKKPTGGVIPIDWRGNAMLLRDCEKCRGAGCSICDGSGKVFSTTLRSLILGIPAPAYGTCPACGDEGVPLTAAGTYYGSVCAECRRDFARVLVKEGPEAAAAKWAALEVPS